MGAMTTILSLIAGLVGLYCGAEWLVRGATRIAVSLRISPLLIGLTVVAFGTSMPEMVAGAVAAWNGNTDIVLGNVFGSNIANVGLILGVAALLRVVPVRLQLLRREVPLMLLATVAVYAIAAGGRVERWHGALLFAGLIGFTVLAMQFARQERATVEREFARFSDEIGRARRPGILVDVVWVIAGLVALAIGARLLVSSAVQLARTVGISEFLISVSIVAIGTSLPELATSVVASLRGESDVLVGNIVGSNVFNLLGALGISALIRPLPVASEIVRVDLPVVLAFGIAMLVTLRWHRAVVRWEGALLLAGYVVYLAMRFS